MSDGSEFGSNIVPAEVSSGLTHKQSFRITELQRDTAYGATINCENEFGETGWTEMFSFNTSQGNLKNFCECLLCD